ncbi:MAG: Fe-S cluster assembly protein NifU [Planctomycetes bacterium]|nr:Fe-S cluster assembly protein NifU [Planctomycetota bacterium]
MWDYTEKVREHFLHPKHAGEIENPDLDATVGNITCGDALRLMVKLDDAGRIADARFQTFGCASAIASSDALIDLIMGKTVEEAEAITNDDIAEYLDGLPEAKMHCSVMGMEALQKAIARYRHKPFTLEDEGKIVCRCFGVTDKLIEKIVREHNLHTVDQVTHFTKAGGGCRGCHREIMKIIERMHGSSPEHAAKVRQRQEPMTNLERIRRIQQIIEDDIRPMLQADGGDLELVDIDGRHVKVALRGHCAWCRAKDFTLKGAVEDRLRELVDPEIVVDDVGGRLPDDTPAPKGRHA